VLKADDRRPHLSDTLRLIARTVTTERVELGTIAQLMGRRAIGAMLLVLALPMVVPVPAIGISVPFGMALILISLQLLLTRQKLWLPSRVAAYSISRHRLVAFVETVLPSLRRAEWLVRPRLFWLTASWVMVRVGAVCVALFCRSSSPFQFPSATGCRGLPSASFHLASLSATGWR
jgi:hypothetical protein